jgi:hypothetical protein
MFLILDCKRSTAAVSSSVLAILLATLLTTPADAMLLCARKDASGNLKENSAIHLRTTCKVGEKPLPVAIVDNETTVRFTGVDLQIVSGSGTTDGPVNGRGNLIVGYNETDSEGDSRQGSHNVILGSGNSYKSYGGIIAGQLSSIGAPYASIIGGDGSGASGEGSVVVGSRYSYAAGPRAVVIGGFANEAHGEGSATVGSSDSFTFGSFSAVIGGEQNKARGVGAVTTGVNDNGADGRGSTVSGGWFNRAGCVDGAPCQGLDGAYTSVSGGMDREATSTGGWAAGSLSEPN